LVFCGVAISVAFNNKVHGFPFSFITLMAAATLGKTLLTRLCTRERMMLLKSILSMKYQSNVLSEDILFVASLNEKTRGRLKTDQSFGSTAVFRASKQLQTK
jgi:hypothetical protein